jgi:hypothetical protein
MVSAWEDDVREHGGVCLNGGVEFSTQLSMGLAYGRDSAPPAPCSVKERGATLPCSVSYQSLCPLFSAANFLARILPERMLATSRDSDEGAGPGFPRRARPRARLPRPPHARARYRPGARAQHRAPHQPPPDPEARRRPPRCTRALQRPGRSGPQCAACETTCVARRICRCSQQECWACGARPGHAGARRGAGRPFDI